VDTGVDDGDAAADAMKAINAKAINAKSSALVVSAAFVPSAFIACRR